MSYDPTVDPALVLSLHLVPAVYVCGGSRNVHSLLCTWVPRQCVKCWPFGPAGRSMRGSTRRTYDQVNDVHDTRVPIYNEDAFQYGILFKAKVREWW